MTVSPASTKSAAAPLQVQGPVRERPEIHRIILTDPSDLDGLFGSAGECLQLTPGAFGGELRTLRLGALRIIEISSNCGIHLRGDPGPNSLLIGCIKGSDGILEHGRVWSSGSMVVVRESQVDLTAAFRLDAVLVQIDLSLLGESERASLLRQAGATSSLVAAQSSAFLSLCRNLRATFNSYVDDGAALAGLETQREAEAELLAQIIRALGTARMRESETKTASRRFSLVRRVEDYMWEHVEEPLTLERICANMNCRMRSLIYSFKEVFGIGPMTYLKICRLNAARRKLRAAGDGTRIFDVAADFGFWHMGHFSSDYKRMFGTTASRTITSAKGGGGRRRV